jgi:hypothetical protein
VSDCNDTELALDVRRKALRARKPRQDSCTTPIVEVPMKATTIERSFALKACVEA